MTTPIDPGARSTAVLPRNGPPARRAHLVSRRGLQLALGALWLLDAAFQAEPANFARGYPLNDLAQSVMGGPGWENHLIFAGLRPFDAHWPWWNAAAVALEAGIGLCLLTRRALRPALAASIAWALVIWTLGEGFGMLPTGYAQLLFGAPGAALLYAALAVLAWPDPGRRDVSPTLWRSVWGVLWLGAAALELPAVYSPGVSLAANFEESSLDQRAVLAHLSHAVAGFALAHPVAFTVTLALVQLAIGLAAFGPRRRLRPFLAAAVVLSALYWVVGQQLGGLLNAGATDPGSAPLVILLALVVWERRGVRARRAAGPGRSARARGRCGPPARRGGARGAGPPARSSRLAPRVRRRWRRRSSRPCPARAGH